MNPGTTISCTVTMFAVGLRRPFRVAFGEFRTLDRVIVTLETHGTKGLGEAAIEFPFAPYDAWDTFHALSPLADRPHAVRDLERAVQDLLGRWQKPDGSFRSRQLFIGWDSVPMHRWAQSQLFRSLCFLLYEECGTGENNWQTGESNVRYLRAV